ncbi:MAG: RNA methyltransferase [Candidatus Riflebacteria bacterium]|nr:RNA methyltransferase [Candidatus Riflebacteria bacterium]
MATERRLQKLRQVLHRRQSDLVLALEYVHDPHNMAAVVRTADAVGISKVLWLPDYASEGKINTAVSKGTEKWVEVVRLKESLSDELLKYREKGYGIAVTHMAKESVDFRTPDWTKPWVIVFGNEHRGCSDEIAEMADVNIYLPMAGFVQSLNISVAAAVTMYEIQRQRFEAGMYSLAKSKEETTLYYDKWKLEDMGIELGEVLEPFHGLPDALDSEHQDGRSNKTSVEALLKKQK